jgi:DNA recombination protein RmuC
MELLTTVIIVFLAVNLVLTAFLLYRFRSREATPQSNEFEAAFQSLKSDLLAKQMEGMLSLRDSLDSANRLLNERLSEGTQALDRRMRLFGEIEHRLGELAVQTKKIESIGSNIQSLSELLRPPKLRGSVGEILLENLLAQIMPTALFETQYRFESGRRVDAVVKLGERLLPIDSKFPLESYQRLASSADDPKAEKEFAQIVKKHVDDIADKYLRPDENTTDIALMYIPAEAVYYQFVSQDNRLGFDYALSRKIIPTSPGHLYAFLASLASVYKQAGLTSGSRRLVAALNHLTESVTRLVGYHGRIEGSLRSISTSFDKARQETSSIVDQLHRLQEPEPEDADV